MMPPELLHTSGCGLIKYIFKSLQLQIGSGKIRDDIDKLHVRVYMSIKRQSEHDFPRGAMRNGIIDGTKCQLEERKGNLFLLLCIANTTKGSLKLQHTLGHNHSKWKKWLEFITLYLSMENWFHDCNNKEEVIQARPLIAKVLKLLQWLFPSADNTNGYCIPKMHGMTKFQYYIKRYGYAKNFFGGMGESVTARIGFSVDLDLHEKLLRRIGSRWCKNHVESDLYVFVSIQFFFVFRSE
jgi:hypothetical protein